MTDACLGNQPGPILPRTRLPLSKERFDEADSLAVGGGACDRDDARRDLGHHGSTRGKSGPLHQATIGARRNLVRTPQRHAFSGTFTLRWTLSRSLLHGSITLSNPRGKYGISGSVKGNAISFGAVGVGATYTGSVSGKSMSGSYKSPQGGGKWSARKTS